MHRVAIVLALTSCTSGTPETRAAGFLAREVPAWPVQNKCYSCHNNGDAARALYAARERSIPFDVRSLDSTTRWLSRPEGWKDNGPDEEFSDKRLAALQFAFALLSAFERGEVADRAVLERAADLVRDLQQRDGSWKVDEDSLPGSPVTYGRTLATVAARRVLHAAGPARFVDALARADAWIRRQRPVIVLDAAAVLMGLASMQGEEGQRAHCLEILKKGQSNDGGWGPYVTSPPEVFDTAVVMLGLLTVRDQPGVADRIAQGRAFLLAAQHSDGSWPETTRPPGAVSYAQRISTSGWATLALLASLPKSAPRAP